MSLDLISALAVFAFVTSITPGPNNLMLMASGANFGFRRSVAHMLGIGIGFMVMIVVVGFGLAQIFELYPVSKTILKICSVAYMLYLAWRIMGASAPGADRGSSTPISFLEAAGFQWVNPKAWAMALTSISVYAPDQSMAAVLSVALIFGAINLPCVSSWTLLGLQLRRLLSNPAHLRVFNTGMAVLLIVSLIPVLAAI